MNKKLISAPNIKITSISIGKESADVLMSLKFNKARWYRIPKCITFVLHTKEHGDIQFTIFGDFYFDGRSGPWCVDWFEPNLGPLNKRLAWLVHDLLGYATYFDFKTTNEVLRQLLIIAGDSKIKAYTVRYFVSISDSWFGVPVEGDKFYPNIGKFEIKRLHDTKGNILENRKVDLREFRKVGKEKGKEMTNVQIATATAFSYLRAPYIWGGDGTKKYWGGVDCSGYIQLVLGVVGLDPKGDQTAQALFNAYKLKKTDARIEGCLLFFGKSENAITHVAYCLSPAYMIEAGGGNSKCTTVAIAESVGACVKVSKVSRRSDLVAIVNPFA